MARIFPNVEHKLMIYIFTAISTGCIIIGLFQKCLAIIGVVLVTLALILYTPSKFGKPLINGSEKILDIGTGYDLLTINFAKKIGGDMLFKLKATKVRMIGKAM
ncbi:MAG: hypothetical protein DRJ30_03985 [Candidatus Methanomethylicota archaeon]|nr:MAG: hypothetical protein DRJ30_03985 [Candidatus Verstraetearchaeota archaeon]